MLAGPGNAQAAGCCDLPRAQDAVVQGVRLRLSATHASILIDVVDTQDQVVERVVSG